MFGSSNTSLKHRQPPSTTDYYKNDLGIKSTTGRTSRLLSTPLDDELDEDYRISRKQATDQSLNASRFRSSSNNSLKSLVIDGQWKYREHENDQLRFKSMGIENLVPICHEIMKNTLESTNQKRRKPSSQNSVWPIVKLNEFKRLTDTDRISLRRAHVFDLMTIVYQAASTSDSISQLVRIWREASEHVLHPRRSKSSENQPLISYEKAFHHLIRTPNDHLLQIVLHASLIKTYSQSELQRLGEKLGLHRNEFNMNSIRDSLKAFEKLIQLLRERKLREQQERKFIDRKRLPFTPKKKQGLYVNVSDTKFHLVRQAVETSGFSISSNADFTCNLLWNDTLISMDIVSALKPYQKVNHFPAMNQISRKDLLAKNYDRLKYVLPTQYNFVPKTWTLPNEYNLWYSYASNQPKTNPSTYIVKPTSAAKGQGVELYCNYKQIKCLENFIIQEYIREPYLINGFKFDLRIYVLITSCDPLRIFIFNNGLIRMSSTKYQIPTPDNIFDLSMHSTNYFVDETNLDFDNNDGRKQPLEILFKHLEKEKRDGEKLWKEINDIIIKTIFLAEPHLLAAYKTCRPGTLSTSESVCFEILAFDILIDKHLKPWIIEVNRCPNYEADEQIEFYMKIKLLHDTFDLLRFRISDRKKSMEIEKVEAQRRLYLSIGKRSNDQIHQLDEMRENLFLLRREKTREIFESHHSGDFIRVFPVNDDNRMNELMNILAKSFQVLYSNKDDLTWSHKYYQRFNEKELLHSINHLEQTNPHLTSNTSLELDRTSFSFETRDNENDLRSRSRSSERTRQTPSPTIDPSMKKVSTQTPFDISRSSSALSLSKKQKSRSNSVASTGDVHRPQVESRKTPPGVSANRITEKKAYSTISLSSENIDQQRPHSSKRRKSNDKSQMVTSSSILQATRIQQLTHSSITIDITKELQLTDNDLNRLYQLIYIEMTKLCIRYPNKSDKETDQICTEIIDNWSRYKSDIGRFWLVELDANKRQSVIEIVWKNIQQIMKKLCLVDDLVQQLPLNRQLMKLERRLLANHGQCFWETCQNKHNSWKLLFTKNTNSLTDIELDCCYQFVDLCREALFITYQFSIDEKFHKQKHTDHHLTLMIRS